MNKVSQNIVHCSQYDPDTRRGGVETFARNLRLVFDDVTLMFDGAIDVERARRERAMVICDNHWVAAWPDDMSVVGFQHGVSAVKAGITRSRRDRDLARRQAAAAARPDTIWVACAAWIGQAFRDLHGNGADYVIRHPVDLDRFDGNLAGTEPDLVLHDARLDHKGKALVTRLARWFPAWRFAPLDCPPDEVPDRLRTARAFVHLSRYEGNSLVCNEAMAMNLPCFFTNVGLLSDRDGPTDVWVVQRDVAFTDPAYLRREFAAFLHSLDTRTYAPRRWTLEHAHMDVARQRWAEVTADWRRRADHT